MYILIKMAQRRCMCICILYFPQKLKTISHNYIQLRALFSKAFVSEIDRLIALPNADNDGTDLWIQTFVFGQLSFLSSFSINILNSIFTTTLPFLSYRDLAILTHKST